MESRHVKGVSRDEKRCIAGDDRGGLVVAMNVKGLITFFLFYEGSDLLHGIGRRQ